MASFSSVVMLLLLLSSLGLIVQHASAGAGWCYQCNSNNPRCGVQIDPSMQIDKTPCNGQCYTSIRENTLYRGCSWEHGFMTRRAENVGIDEKDRLWVFCDTPLCNSDASSLMSGICYDESCDYFDFPQDCAALQLYTLCGKQCGNQLC